LSQVEFRDIVGQDRAIDLLQRAMDTKQMPHALLFLGPLGVGRRTTALALAKTLLCQSPAAMAAKGADRPLVQACGHCDDCRMMASGNHPDFHLVYKELARYHDNLQVRSRVMQDLGIDVIRSSLIAPAAIFPTRGRARVFVVLEADLMNNPAQSALLKTLEEPPSGVTIILICSKREQLLPTTLSRCATIRFSLLPKDFVISKLVSTGIDQVQAEFWAAFTTGSVGRAIDLAGKNLYEIKRNFVGKLAGMGPAGCGELAEELSKATDNLASKAVASAKAAQGAELSKTLAGRQAAGAMLELLTSAYRDAMGLAAGEERTLVHADQQHEIESIAAKFTLAELAGIIESLSRCEQLLWNNVNQRIVWDNAIIACASAKPLGV